ncbi:chromosome segregation ATPase [Methanosarcina hadiensis]|uniref:chromosome segregation ATPase n=1 Tax=Methanosarcina hadiensis TaxID=3078083 RepID=UPI0039777304
MKKLPLIKYLAYIIFILIIFSILAGEAFAAGPFSENGNGNQYANKNIIDIENYEKDSSNNTNDTNNTSGTENSSSGNLKDENKDQTQDRDRYSTYRQQREQIREDLQLQKDEYREAKEDFLKVKNQIQAGKLNPGSEEAIDATKLYLNSSISYMIAHLKNVKTNMQYSNGSGVEEKTASIDESIKLLEAERAEVEDASNQQELITAVRSVHAIWTDAQKTSLAGSGQIVSQRIGEFLDKSENLSEELDVEIQRLNETGVYTANLQTRLASYKLYIKAAQEKKAAADTIYGNESVTQKDLEVANNYLREALNNVNKANQILKVIFDELKEHGFKEISETGTENSLKTEINNTTNTY